MTLSADSLAGKMAMSGLRWGGGTRRGAWVVLWGGERMVMGGAGR